MNFRHEQKHIITKSDLYTLRARLSAVMEPDPHAIDGRYSIRSLYFDDLYDHALREKKAGTERREKFRIRYYNLDPSLILLEKKSKFRDLTEKKQEVLTLSEAEALSKGGSFPSLETDGKPLLTELLAKIRYQTLRPMTIVDYVREPFIYAPGNVRVTLDHSIRTGLSCTDFLDPDCVMIPAGDTEAVLEVKWDGFLPSFIKDLVRVPGTRTTAFSKYEAARIFG